MGSGVPGGTQTPQFQLGKGCHLLYVDILFPTKPAKVSPGWFLYWLFSVHNWWVLVLYCFCFVLNSGQAGRGLMVTDGDTPHHLGPLAELSGLLTGEQLQLLIEFTERHYGAGAAGGLPRPCGIAPWLNIQAQ